MTWRTFSPVSWWGASRCSYTLFAGAGGRPVADPVLLVDGVGNGVLIQREQDALTIVVGGRAFEKMRDQYDGMDVYRLDGSFTRTGWPRIRHVNKHLVPA